MGTGLFNDFISQKTPYDLIADVFMVSNSQPIFWKKIHIYNKKLSNPMFLYEKIKSKNLFIKSDGICEYFDN